MDAHYKTISYIKSYIKDNYDISVSKEDILSSLEMNYIFSLHNFMLDHFNISTKEEIKIQDYYIDKEYDNLLKIHNEGEIELFTFDKKDSTFYNSIVEKTINNYYSNQKEDTFTKTNFNILEEKSFFNDDLMINLYQFEDISLKDLLYSIFSYNQLLYGRKISL